MPDLPWDAIVLLIIDWLLLGLLIVQIIRWRTRKRWRLAVFAAANRGLRQRAQRGDHEQRRQQP